MSRYAEQAPEFASLTVGWVLIFIAPHWIPVVLEWGTRGVTP